MKKYTFEGEVTITKKFRVVLTESDYESAIECAEAMVECEVDYPTDLSSSIIGETKRMDIDIMSYEKENVSEDIFEREFEFVGY